jgi:hypothetical protein
MQTNSVFFKNPSSGKRKSLSVQAAAAVLLLLLCVIFAACSRGPSDEELQKKVAAALDNDTQLQGQKLDIAVKEGELTIAGEVPTDAERLKAYKKAADTPGVKKVNDHMKLQPPPPPPRVYTLHAGTTVRVVMLSGVDSSVNRVGQTFPSSLVFALTSGDTVIIPEGTEVLVMLAEAQQAGRLKGASQLEVTLKSITYLGTTYELKSETVSAVGESRGNQSAKRIGIATGVGAAVGAIAGKGKGALIGAGIGAAGSTAYQLATTGPSVRIPAQTKLDFKLRDAVTITLPPKEQ